MSAFTEAYGQLNDQQRQAVDTIEGPLLVIAGPGTGKTQLLSARVANILQETDTPAQNILCLTFTESGAANMRERLTRFIGQEAYNVNINTYHAFGSDLINRYPEYFAATRLQTPIDDLGKRQVTLEIVEAMSYSNPLKQTRHHLGDLMSTLSELKRALLSSDNLRALAAENISFIQNGSKQLISVFADFSRMPGSYTKALPYFEQTLVALHSLIPSSPIANGFKTHFETLAAVCVSELQASLEVAATTRKTTALTDWKNSWLAKDADNHFIIAGELENRRLAALADVLDAYQSALAEQGLYDFDDMILRSIEALETHIDLRLSLQERYLYILLDEFQDTNAAQLKLVQLLSDNPINEGRPNILAVGDDDQAIYAFQGAQYSNMLEYYRMFRGTLVINLTDNYRSHADILTIAGAVARQIDSRLEQHFPNMTKTLRAANHSIRHATVERRDFQSDIAERAWIASKIKQLIDSGTAPSQIAVLAPKHRHIEPLVPYLNAHDVPVRYEKRENILDATIVRQLITMSQLVLALASNNTAVCSALWPQVLSYDFWEIPTDVIWRLSWQVSDVQSNQTENANRLSWNQAVLDNDNGNVKLAAEVLLAAAGRVATESCETILDYLLGSAALENHQTPSQIHTISSPLKDYYTSPAMQLKQPELFYATLSHLTVLRARLREFQDRADMALTLSDFIRFIGLYEAAEQPMIDTSPYAQQADAVQLLTVFKAKGLEYEHVFLPECLDDVWGSNSRGSSNKLTLPPNIQPIRHAGATDDERLRILFVALTRAKVGLHLTGATRTFSGKTTKRLKYFDEQEQPDGSFKALILPQSVQQVITDDSTAPTAELLELDWHTRHRAGLNNVSLSSLLSERTTNYQLSPTHVTSFIDLEYAGPQRFFFDTILKFPTAPSADSQFGTTVHETLEWYQHQLSEYSFAPTLAATLEHFSERLSSRKLTEQRKLLEIERGNLALSAYIKQRGHIFTESGVAEKNFRSEGVFYGDVHMAGRIDRMEIDTGKRLITVVDYKTGKSYSSWKNDVRLYKYRLQLYAYKLLIEGSRTYAGYTVTTGRLEFIEPNSDGHIEHLELTFTDTELKHVTQLLTAIWHHVKTLSFPDTGGYPVTVAGIKQFEQDMIDGTI